MAFRFQKRIKLFPGITVNVSKSGLSTSVGTRGARVTMGHGKRRTTVGLPGTGLSHTSITSAAEPGAASSASRAVVLIVIGAILLAILLAVIR